LIFVAQNVSKKLADGKPWAPKTSTFCIPWSLKLSRTESKNYSSHWRLQTGLHDDDDNSPPEVQRRLRNALPPSQARSMHLWNVALLQRDCTTQYFRKIDFTLAAVITWNLTQA
jgi:hypothetical protein